MAVLVISAIASVSLFPGPQERSGEKIEEDMVRLAPSHKLPLIENLVYSPPLDRQREDKESAGTWRDIRRAIDKTVNDRDGHIGRDGASGSTDNDAGFESRVP